MRKFEVGKIYAPYAMGFDPIVIIKRTDRTIWCDNNQTQFRMRIKTDLDGNEYAIDSTVPAKWRDAFTYKA